MGLFPALRVFLPALLLLAFARFSFAQWIPANPVAGAQKEADGVLIRMQTGTLKLQVCTESIIHVLYSPTGKFPPPNAVVIKNSWTPSDWHMAESDKDITLSTASLRVVVARADGTINYFANGRAPLLSEGPKLMTPKTPGGHGTFSAEDVFKIYGSEEAFYGLGQHQAGAWNFRGESIDLSQENANIAVPFFLSSKGYGVFWNNTSASRWNNRFVHFLYLHSDYADAIDYYFFYGPDFDKMIADYRELTGGTPLFGKWAYGFWQCKNKYSSQDELLGVAKKYRDLHIPVDNIVQDWFWWTTTGEFKFNDKYPAPAQMIQQLHDEHFHLMISVWPFFDPGTQTYADMDKRGYFITRTKVAGFHPKGAAVYDAFNPEARKYYWNLIDESLFKIGADAWWMDTTEPETEGREENVLFDNKVSTGNGGPVANLYPLMTTTGFMTDKEPLPPISAFLFLADRRLRAFSAMASPPGPATFFRIGRHSNARCPPG